MTDEEKQKYMSAALALAKEAYDDGEVPVGAVIVRDGEIIATGRNRREKGKNALYHAETEAIDNACKTLGGWRLPRCDLFVTLEPCPMCAGAIINSRIEHVYFGANDKKAGSVGSLINLFEIDYNHKPYFEGGIKEAECAEILSDFFRQLRLRK
jgi:tRNA(adenine34) deaminase